MDYFGHDRLSGVVAVDHRLGRNLIEDDRQSVAQTRVRETKLDTLAKDLGIGILKIGEDLGIRPGSTVRHSGRHAGRRSHMHESSEVVLFVVLVWRCPRWQNV